MRVIALFLLATFTSVAIAKSPPRYRFHRLSPFGGAGHSQAVQINNDGTVIGSAETNGSMHAVLWRNGMLIDLGVLPGAQNSFGIAINDVEQFIANAPGSYFRSDLVLPPPDYSMGGAAALNNAGVVAGAIVNLNSGGSLPFTYQNGMLTVLPSLIPGGYASPIDINNSGRVLVAAQKTQSDAVPVIYDGTNIIDDLSAALTAASFRISSQGTAINDLSHVVGSGEVTLRPRKGVPYETVRAFIYRDGAVADLAPLRHYNYSQATGLNESDEVVGTCSNTSTERSTPFLWRKGRMYNLAKRIVRGTDGWKLIGATGINDEGFIIGFAGKDGDQQAFLLEPLGRRHSRPW